MPTNQRTKPTLPYPDNYWSLERAKKENAKTTTFDAPPPKLPPTPRNEHRTHKPRTADGKFTK